MSKAIFNNKKRALSLLSGGLDSLLATKLIINQNIHVEGIHFDIGFTQNNSSGAESVAKQLGIKLHIVNSIDKFKPIIQHPKYGFGSHINPCLDCKIFMVNAAVKFAQINNFDFIITGEVVGQRPKSQRAKTMPLIAFKSSANDLLLRPLCAKLLPITKAEKNGWVDRNKLYSISGRSRSEQFTLAKKFGFTEHPTPAGGCLLTEDVFSIRMRDLWKSRGRVDYNVNDLKLLRIGRHLRINKNYKIIIGKDQKDNAALEQYFYNHIYLKTISHPGPVALVDGIIKDSEIEYIAKIVSYFSKGKNSESVTLSTNNNQLVKCKPMSKDDFNLSWHV